MVQMRQAIGRPLRVEIETLPRRMECWDIIDKEHWMNVPPSTWAFRCKRHPDGRIKKFKGRFCARGDRQLENVDVFETFAPSDQLDDQLDCY